jgi:hypothetical protein
MTQVPIWPDRDRTTGRGSVDHLERYYTPDDLAAFLVGLLPWDGVQSVLEPHAGGGAFLRALRDLDGLQVKANDTDPHSWAVQHGGATCCDLFSLHTKADRVVGNPPFSNAEAHVERCLQLADEVAFLMPLDRLETAGRLAFWQRHPPRRIWVLAERVWSGSRACAFYWWTKTHTHTQLDVISWKGSK